ncbi:unnamed protein product [Orchesella dallaii]|uniref:Amine oxidase n=1 Tax=Orchesella dallaii TaxID=48710 RepID=A0ABP1Q0X5_9HEXA
MGSILELKPYFKFIQDSGKYPPVTSYRMSHVSHKLPSYSASHKDFFHYLMLLVFSHLVNSRLRRDLTPWARTSNRKPNPNQLLLHPLDPLTEDEINTTSAIIRHFRRGNWIFNYITLKEPEKYLLLPSFLQDRPPESSLIPRKSFTILLDRATNHAYEVTVNLYTKQVEAWDDAPDGVTPTLTPEELLLSERIMRADVGVQERCRQLGWGNMSLVFGDPWSMGYIGDRPEFHGRRLIMSYLYGRNFDNDCQYAHPFDFIAIVDILQEKVIAIEELPTHGDFDARNKQGNRVPRETSNYEPQLQHPESFRKDLKPVTVSQRGGPSYIIKGNEISWQKFKMRIGFNGREGMTLHNVNYNDGGRVRPLFYRMSLAEMFVPYGDPRPPYHRKHVFDGGQYGIGFGTNSLTPQLDCIGEVHMFDFFLHNQKGEAQKLKRAVCVHEEDGGILWKHTDFRNGRSSITRSQRLAVTFMATVGNYDYIYTWHFHQDGTIKFTIGLTGILSVHLIAEYDSTAGHGSIVFPRINAPFHQHFFALRIDPEVDGNMNTVVVSDMVPGSSPELFGKNPYGQAFHSRKIPLRTAGEGRTQVAPELSRSWLISNQNSLHPYTHQPVAWKFEPWASPPMLMSKESPIHPMAEFLDYNTWVTPYKEGQMFPGGFYLNNSGLPEWVREDEGASIENRDVVFWHNFGISHVPRVEDFPVMPVVECGVVLKPYNFFKENPALDVLPPGKSEYGGGLDARNMWSKY